jgi:hypothetical protein
MSNRARDLIEVLANSSYDLQPGDTVKILSGVDKDKVGTFKSYDQDGLCVVKTQGVSGELESDLYDPDELEKV